MSVSRIICSPALSAFFRLCIILAAAHRQGRSFDGRRILVVGAGDAGTHIIEMFESSGSMGQVVLIADDDPAKKGFLIHDIPIAGKTDDIPELVESDDITDIIIAVPTASEERLKEITDICLSTGCYVRVMDKLKHVEQKRFQ
ncbi:MAG: tryptophan synthase subunit alpha, partial [Bacteroidales bacterium]|nr:tryptophan synthase subunit alpha [Bacteroidales bacterium]